MRRVSLFVALVFVSLMAFPAQALAPKCDPAAVIKLANGLKSAKNAQKDMAALMKLQDSITAAHIACNGLTFTGKANKVSQPFVLQPGTYKVKAVTKQAIILTLRTLAGSDCTADQQVSILNELNLAGDGVINAESILPVEAACRVVFQTANNTDNWTITFEPIE